MRKPTLKMFKKYWQVASGISDLKEPMNDPVNSYYDCWGESTLNESCYGFAKINEGMRHRESLQEHGFNRLIEFGCGSTILYATMRHGDRFGLLVTITENYFR